MINTTVDPPLSTQDELKRELYVQFQIPIKIFCTKTFIIFCLPKLAAGKDKISPQRKHSNISTFLFPRRTKIHARSVLSVVLIKLLPSGDGNFPKNIQISLSAGSRNYVAGNNSGKIPPSPEKSSTKSEPEHNRTNPVIQSAVDN